MYASGKAREEGGGENLYAVFGQEKLTSIIDNRYEKSDVWLIDSKRLFELTHCSIVSNK